MVDELTAEEQARLLAVIDGKSIKSDDYDQAFYKTMRRTHLMALDEVDDQVRRAILRFIMDGQGITSQENNGGLVMMGFIHGYMVGRELKRDIRRKGEGEHGSSS